MIKNVIKLLVMLIFFIESPGMVYALRPVATSEDQSTKEDLHKGMSKDDMVEVFIAARSLREQLERQRFIEAIVESHQISIEVLHRLYYLNNGHNAGFLAAFAIIDKTGDSDRELSISDALELVEADENKIVAFRFWHPQGMKEQDQDEDEYNNEEMQSLAFHINMLKSIYILDKPQDWDDLDAAGLKQALFEVYHFAERMDWLQETGYTREDLIKSLPAKRVEPLGEIWSYLGGIPLKVRNELTKMLWDDDVEGANVFFIDIIRTLGLYIKQLESEDFIKDLEIFHQSSVEQVPNLHIQLNMAYNEAKEQQAQFIRNPQEACAQARIDLPKIDPQSIAILNEAISMHPTFKVKKDGPICFLRKNKHFFGISAYSAESYPWNFYVRISAGIDPAPIGVPLTLINVDTGLTQTKRLKKRPLGNQCAVTFWDVEPGVYTLTVGDIPGLEMNATKVTVKKDHGVLKSINSAA